MNTFFKRSCPFVEYFVRFAGRGISKKDSLITSGIKFPEIILTIVVYKASASKDSKMSNAWRVTLDELVRSFVQNGSEHCPVNDVAGRVNCFSSE